MKDVIGDRIQNEALERFYQQTVGVKHNPLLLVHPCERVLPDAFLKCHERIRDFEVYEDDIWITGFPKSGTKWMQELVWCVMNNVDLETAKTKYLDERVPFFERAIVSTVEFSDRIFDYADGMERPRYFKTHLSLDLLPKQVIQKKPKIIHIIRNPRDICASFHHHWRVLRGYSGDMDTLVEMMTTDCMYYSPYFTNVFSYWNKRNDMSNLLILTYEELKADLPKAIKEIADFLGEDMSEENIAKLCDHVSIDKMRVNPMVNDSQYSLENFKTEGATGNLLNTGKTGNWKDKLSSKLIEKIKTWEEKWLKDSDLKFVYEL